MCYSCWWTHTHTELSSDGLLHLPCWHGLPDPDGPEWKSLAYGGTERGNSTTDLWKIFKRISEKDYNKVDSPSDHGRADMTRGSRQTQSQVKAYFCMLPSCVEWKAKENEGKGGDFSTGLWHKTWPGSMLRCMRTTTTLLMLYLLIHILCSTLC